jgi:hypothetical protein
LAGLTTPKESAAGTLSPPMVMTKSDMMFPDSSAPELVAPPLIQFAVPVRTGFPA